MKFTDAWLDEGQKRQVTRGRASGVPFVHAGDSHPCSVPDALYPTPRVIVLARRPMRLRWIYRSHADQACGQLSITLPPAV
jgi:hypothetical protein